MKEDQTNKQLQTLIGKLINKDYFKLEFGCKLKITKAEDNRVYMSGKRDFFIETPFEAIFLEDYYSGCGDPQCCGDMGTKYACVGKDVFNLEDIGDVKEFEILGTEPTLQDVLLAIRKAKTQGTCYLRDDGTFFHWKGFAQGGSGNHIVESDYITMDFTKSLFNQSEQTKVAIIGLLEK